MTGEYDLVKTAVQEIEDRPGLYCIFNSETGMLYVGCSNNARTRIVTHKRQMANGDHLCRQMSADYIKNSEVFVFFVLEYVDFDLYPSLDMHRSVLLNRETQYMKRVPHVKLYNNSIPVSMSEKLLMSEIPVERIKVNVSDIFRRLEMSPDSIRANGYSIQDELNLPEAIEFVRKRTVANGRWPQEKADLAISYLQELESMVKPESESVSELIAGSRFDYFGDYVVKAPPPARQGWPTFGLSEFLALAVYGHTALVWYEVAVIFALPGILAGVVLFALKHAAVVICRSEKYTDYAPDALAVAFILDGLAVWVHYTAFSDAMPDRFKDGAEFWAALILGLVVASGAFVALYFTNKTSKQ